jgi:serine/threonine-protein kinase
LAEARRALERALEIAPAQAYAIANLAEVLLLSAQPREALELAEKIPWEAARLSVAARAQHDLGRVAESRKTLDALIRDFSTTDALWIANVFAWRGDKDTAFEWLDRAMHQPGWIASVKTDPVFSKLRNDPRWKPLLQKMNFPPD